MQTATKATPIARIRFDAYDVLDLMAKEYVIQTSEKIVKASEASLKGVLKKACMSDPHIERCSKKMEKSIRDTLEDSFSEELSSRFTEEDFIILNFFQDQLEVNISDVFAKTTDDIRILFYILFIRKIDQVVLLDDLKVQCDNCTLISEISKNIDSSIQLVKLVCKGFPFCFPSEDFQKPEQLNKRFSKLKTLRNI